MGVSLDLEYTAAQLSRFTEATSSHSKELALRPPAVLYFLQSTSPGRPQYTWPRIVPIRPPQRPPWVQNGLARIKVCSQDFGSKLNCVPAGLSNTKASPVPTCPPALTSKPKILRPARPSKSFNDLSRLARSYLKSSVEHSLRLVLLRLSDPVRQFPSWFLTLALSTLPFPALQPAPPQ